MSVAATVDWCRWRREHGFRRSDLGGEDRRCELLPESTTGASRSAPHTVGLHWSLGTAGSLCIGYVTVLRSSVERGRRESSPETHWRHLKFTVCGCEDDSRSPPNAAPSAARPNRALTVLTPASNPLATVAVCQDCADCLQGVPRIHLTAALSKRHPAPLRFDRSRSIGTLFTFAGIRTQERTCESDKAVPVADDTLSRTARVRHTREREDLLGTTVPSTGVQTIICPEALEYNHCSALLQQVWPLITFRLWGLPRTVSPIAPLDCTPPASHFLCCRSLSVGSHGETTSSNQCQHHT